MSPIRVSLLVVALATLSSGCASVAPKYAPVPDTVNALRDADLAPVQVGEFTADPKNNVNVLTIRGGTYSSPYENSYVKYLQEALRLELRDARLLDPAAAVELSGVLVRNELNAGGFSTADAQIEARFVVKRGGRVCYDQVKAVKHEWDSNFLGAIAIPRAQQNYPVAVQRLVSALFTDPAFVAATKKP